MFRHVPVCHIVSLPYAGLPNAPVRHSQFAIGKVWQG